MSTWWRASPAVGSASPWCWWWGLEFLLPGGRSWGRRSAAACGGVWLIPGQPHSHAGPLPHLPGAPGDTLCIGAAHLGPQEAFPLLPAWVVRGNRAAQSRVLKPAAARLHPLSLEHRVPATLRPQSSIYSCLCRCPQPQSPCRAAQCVPGKEAGSDPGLSEPSLPLLLQSQQPCAALSLVNPRNTRRVAWGWPRCAWLGQAGPGGRAFGGHLSP